MIPEVSIDAIDAFERDFYRPEQPVVFRRSVTSPDSVDGISRKLNARIAADDTVTQRQLWYDVPRTMLDQICATPPLVDRLMNPKDAFLRENCVRVWFNPRGHITPWHYDGHSLHVFNLQLKGKKRWTIIAPETPPLCTPFSHTTLFKHVGLENKRYYQFDLNEGDMLFLPRYWFHYVESEGEMNINVNWVLMPKAKPAPTRTAKREAEMMWIKQRLEPVLPGQAKRTVKTYAGKGHEAVSAITGQVSKVSAFRRGLIELSRTPLLAVALPNLLGKLRTLTKSKRLLRTLKDQQPLEAQPMAYGK
jgi:hypothetical protein